MKFRSHPVIASLLFLPLLISKSAFSDQDIQIGLASQSALKQEAVIQAFKTIYPKRGLALKTFPSESQVADQPVGLEFGAQGAKNRLKGAWILAGARGETIDYWVSIENYIEKSRDSSDQWIDKAIVIVQKRDQTPIIEFSDPVSFDSKYAERARELTPLTYPFLNTGYSKTAGKVIAESFSGATEAIPHDDWHAHPHFGGVSRKTLIQEAIIRAIIKTEINTIEDFPKKGITFRDMTPVLSNPEVFQAVIRRIAENFSKEKIDLVAGLETRGLILGSPLALEMNKPFIAVRKEKRLPRPTYREEYSKEYGKDAIEIAVDHLDGKSVLIVDDLLATGGTLKAAVNLFKKAGAGEIYTTCVIELLDLKGAQELQPFPFFSLIQY